MTDFNPFIKLVVVGDSYVGKTWLISALIFQDFPMENAPTLFDTHKQTFAIHDGEYELTIWDTGGKHDRDKLRRLAYPDTDVILLCYSVDNRASYENIEFKWFPEIVKYCPNVPIILLGMKTDLREVVSNPVSQKEGEFMQHKLNAVAFFEYSFENPKIIPMIFATAVIAGKEKSKDKLSKNPSCLHCLIQ